MIAVPLEYRPPINTTYPAENFEIFESWVANRSFIPFTGDREYLPIQWTAYYVNNNYGQDSEAIVRLQKYIETLDKTKKYWTIVQYDDGILNNVRGIDLLECNMSKKKGIEIPLLCMPHSFKPFVLPNGFGSGRRIFMSFIGNRTHPIREEVLKIQDGFSVITADPHTIDDYCHALANSTWGLCPRGYGINSFRIMECMQYGAIPVYISDEFIEPFGIDFNEYGVKIYLEQIQIIPEILKSFSPYAIEQKRKRMKELYPILCTYEGVFSQIIKTLQENVSER